jgi:GAF domain-containing protein/CheY-like chemotaxis protein
MEALLAVARAVTGGADLVATAEQALDAVGRMAGMETGALYRFDTESGALSVVAHRGRRPEAVAEVKIRPIERSHLGEALRTGRVIVTDLAGSPRLDRETRETLLAAGHRTQLALPIPAVGAPWGVMALVSGAARRFGPEDVRFFEAAAAHISLAVTRVTLLAEAGEKARGLETLGRLSRALTATLALDEVVTKVAEAAVEVLGSSESRVWLADDDGAALVLSGQSGSLAATPGPERVAKGEGLVGVVATTRAPLAVTDLATDPRVQNVERVRAEGLASFAGVPVLLGERLLGVLTVTMRARHTFAAEELALLQSLATHAAVAVDNARRFEEETAHRARLAALVEINTTLEAAEPTEARLTALAEAAARLLGVDNAGFRLVEGEELVVAGLAGTAGQTMQRPRIRIGESFSGQVVKDGRPLTASLDEVPALIPEHRDADTRLGYTHVLGVPLRAGHRIMGVLVFRARRPFTTRHVESAQAFAGQAAVALEHARLSREAQRQAERMRALAGVERLRSTTLDPGVVAQRIAESVRSLLEVQSSAVYRLEATADDLVAIAAADAPGVEPVALFPQGTGVVGLAVRVRRTVISRDPLEDPGVTLTPELRERLAQTPNRSALAVPLRVHDRIIGALGVADRAGRVFDAEEIRLAEVFADQAALALESARLHEETERGRRQAEVLTDLAGSIGAELDLGSVLQRVAEGARDLCGSEMARIALRQPDGDHATFRYGVGARDPDDHHVQIEPGHGAWGLVLTTGRSFRTDDWMADPRTSKEERRMVETEGIVTELAVPIRIGDRVEGLLTVNNRSPQPFTDRHEAILLQLAEHAALVIQNARLYEGLEARAKRLRTLADVNRLVSSSLDTGEVLRAIARAAAELMGGAFVSCWVADEAAGVLRLGAFSDDEVGADVPLQTLAFGEGAGGWVAAHRARLNVPDVGADDRFRGAEWSRRHGLTAYYGLPIALSDRLLGVLSLNGRAPFVVTPDEESLLETLAAQAAVALQHARLYAEAQEHLGEATTLLAVGQMLSETAPVEEMMRRVAREVARAVGADMVGAYTVDPGGVTLAPIAGYRVPEALRPWFLTHPMTLARVPGLTDEWRAGRSVRSADPHHDERFDPEWIRHLPPLSVLFAPTRVRSESVGALFVIWWGTGREFPPAEIRLIEGVAAQVGLALENVELTRQRELRLEETETLLEVTRTLSSALDVEPLLRELMRQIARALGADTVGVWGLDESGQWLSPWRGCHVPAEWVPALEGVRLSIVEHAFYAEGALTRRAVFAREVASDPRIPRFLSTAAPHRSQLFVPILAKERLIGGFIAVWLGEARDLTPRELALMEAIASQAGAALDNARLFEQNRRQVEELSVLHALSRAVTGQLDRQVLLEALRRQVPRVLAADHLVVLLVDDTTGEAAAALRVRAGRVETDTPRSPRSVGLASVVLATGRPLRSEDQGRDCDGRGLARADVDGPPIWLGVPMMTGDRVLGVLALSRHEGPFTDAEERLATNIADLAALALRSAILYEERTRAYGELAAAQDHLVRTEKLRALGEMASGVAHDFNNLLAAILGRAQLLLRHVEEPRLRQWLHVVERSALDGAQTVRRLQEFARVRRDEPQVPVDLHEVVREALEITQPRWRQDALRDGVTVEVETRLGPVPRVAGDPAELREALTNLILNAVDAMPSGGTLTITSAVVEGHVEVAVTDTGTGMPAEVREKIFDPFFTTKGPQGTGLGLSMTYGILSRHRARITVDSEEGRGSTFRIAFPLVPAALPGVEPGAAAPATEALRCLVVDDEEPVASVIGDVLETLGHRTVVLTDSTQAIERLRAEPFDIVFTDLAMPGASGWQVARAAKEVSPELPVFVVTGFGVELSPEERRIHGVEAIYSKPLKIEDIMGAVAQVQRARAGGVGSEGS